MHWIQIYCMDFTLLWCWTLFSVISGDLIKIEEPLIDKSVIKGDTVTFECDVTVDSNIDEIVYIKIRWKHEDQQIDTKSAKYQLMDDGQILVIRDIEKPDGGDYTCVAGIRGRKEKVRSTAKLIVKGPPDPPKSVKIEACVGQHAELTWENGNDGGEAIISYLLQYNTSFNPFYWSSAYEEVSAAEFMKTKSAIIGLSPWNRYSFRILARNSLGYSEPSRPTQDTCNPPPGHPSTNPTGVELKTNKKKKLIITWDPMSRINFNGPGFRYVVQWRRKGHTYWNTKEVNNPHTSKLEIDVDDIYGLYEVTVQAKNEIGPSYQPPFRIVGRSGEAEPLVTPMDFRLDSSFKKTQPHRAHFIWESVDTSEAAIRGKFRGYKLHYWKAIEGRRKWKEVDIIVDNADRENLPDVRAVIDNLPANTALRAQVSVMNGHYTGKPSQIIDFVTSEGVPGPVRNLQKDRIESNFVLLKWLPPDEPNGKLIGYDIGYQPVNRNPMEEIKALHPKIRNPDTLSARITGLQPDYEYRFFVWACTKEGRGDPTSIDVITRKSSMYSNYSGINMASRSNLINLKLILCLSWISVIVVFVFQTDETLLYML